MALPWVSVEPDETGIPCVSVRSLPDVPKFMHYIIKHKIGMSPGAFKVRFMDSTVSQTSLEQLQKFAYNYFTSKIGRRKTLTDELLLEQHFYRGSIKDHIYGYLTDKTDKLSKEEFLKKLKETSTFSTDSSCCLQALQHSMKDLTSHFWNVISSMSSISNGMRKNSTIENEDFVVEARKKFCCFEGPCSTTVPSSSTSHLSPPPCLPLTLPATSASPSGKGTVNKILYGSSIPLDGVNFQITEEFSLSKLESILDLHQEKYPGLAYPYLYVGTPHASFPWHIEDAALFSANYLHHDAPCVWFIVPPSHYKKFVDLSHQLPLDLAQVTCENIMGHKYVAMSSDVLEHFSISVQAVVQKAHEMVIVYPFTAHSGFKLGWNFSEAVNFADPWWVEPALMAPQCNCL